MSKSIYLFFFIVICFYNCQNESNQTQESETKETVIYQDTSPNYLSKEEQKEGWHLLFDGETTQQWRGYNRDTFPTIGWKIDADKNLIVKPGGKGGDIITKSKFENFELKLEFMVSDTANSGIFFLVTEKEGESMWYNAPEYQILDSKPYESMMEEMDMHRAADNYALHASPADYSKPVGEWNHAKIIHNNGHVEHWLNGEKTVDYEINSDDWKMRYEKSKFHVFPGFSQAKEGHIGIQDHNYLVKFRNLKIRKI